MPAPDLTEPRNPETDLSTADRAWHLWWTASPHIQSRQTMVLMKDLIDSVRWWIAFAANAAKSAQDLGKENERLRGLLAEREQRGEEA